MSNPVPLHPHSHGPSFHEEDKPVQYCVPNELLYVVEHDSNSEVDDSLTGLWLHETLRDYDCSYQLPDNVSESLALPGVFFPATANRVKPLTVFTIRADDLDIVQELDRFYAIDTQHVGIPFDGNNMVRCVMPNWFNGAAYHIGIGPHGPGGPPCPVTDPVVIDSINLVIASGLDNVATGDVGNVVVYVLDTLPAKHRIQNALSTWPLLHDHFENILDVRASGVNILETPLATYHYADPAEFAETYVHNLPGHPYAVGNHEYDSSDHGLFIAGIVHQFAPEVPIHVIQVMNEFGVGTFRNFADGFRKMIRLHHALNNPVEGAKPNPQYHAIVNCSFTLSIPIGDYAPVPNPSNDPSDPYAPLLNWISTNQPLIFEQMEYLIAALQAALATGAIIVAASGNDSVAGPQGKDPRYPAKFNSVVGVGAVKRDMSRADYSNRNDGPPSDGVYMFGGDYTTPGGILSGEGIISIFTGNLNISLSGAAPVHPALFNNPTGHAEWKGTSFATPVLAGTLARVSRLRNQDPRGVYNTIIDPLADPITRVIDKTKIDINHP